MSSSFARRFRPASLVAAPLAISALVAAGGAALAHDRGCGGRVVACSEKLASRYATVERPVVVRPSYTEVVTTPAVVQRRAEVVEVAPARVAVVPTQAVYTSVVQKVQVAPARVQYLDSPPVVRRVYEDVTVRTGGRHWEHGHHRHFGCERPCDAPARAVVRSMARDVVVAPARRTVIVTPAVYRDVVRTVQVRPAMWREVYQPAIRQVITRDVVVQPATRRVITHPAVVGVERRAVLVEREGAAWHPRTRFELDRCVRC